MGTEVLQIMVGEALAGIQEMVAMAAQDPQVQAQQVMAVEAEVVAQPTAARYTMRAVVAAELVYLVKGLMGLLAHLLCQIVRVKAEVPEQTDRMRTLHM